MTTKYERKIIIGGIKICECSDMIANTKSNGTMEDAINNDDD